MSDISKKEAQDKLVLELFNTVKRKQKEISEAERPKYKTSCSFGFSNEIKDRINIMTQTDINVLRDILAFLLMKEEYGKAAAAMLGLSPNFKWMNYSLNDWVHDIKARINVINIDDKKEELKVLEKRLDALITPEQRRDLELAEIQALMKE